MSDGLRDAGPHRVRDVGEKGITRRVYTVVCVKCNAEWDEGGIFPVVCGLPRESMTELLSGVEL